MQRSVKGEVIASTFDRPPSDHTQAAELAIERAKRLVEQGKDVIVLLDSITRLGRAYNNASPASGRILSGGVDSTALYPPKRFLGAARNIEFGGSLTIIATAMVETGSTGDTVIFEEFKGTGNAELKLDRKISERRVFPAVDVNPSGTRKDELLLAPDEFAIVHKLRRVLSGLDSHQAIDLLMSQLRKTKNNYEFLMQVSKTAPGWRTPPTNPAARRSVRCAGRLSGPASRSAARARGTVVRVARVKDVARDGHQRDDHAGHPLRGFRRYRCPGGSPRRRARRSHSVPRTRRGRAPVPARRPRHTRRIPRARPSAAASAARPGRRRRCGRAPRQRRSAYRVPRRGSSMACASDQYASFSRTIAAPSSDALSGKCR